ncbi:Alpha/beta hydrolase family-domain-containing protein [Mycena crocata]|nr:Alpha/beta hydrolase family-domain-containing protein [Mycena crocata]
MFSTLRRRFARAMASYPPPHSPRPTIRDCYPPLLPVYPPPVSALPSPLPSPLPPRPFPDSRYAVSTHLVPAAHLRSTPLAPKPPGPVPGTATKAERKARNAERLAWVEAQMRAPRGRHERVLWSAVNRYKRISGGGSGLTLFLAHANGFNKETWEPIILDLLAIPTTTVIDEIWTWEATHHGASFRLNEGTPFAACEWSDDSRDVQNFLLHFLPSSTDAELPPHLARVAPAESALRKVRGFNERRLLAVGHSFGGHCCVDAALAHPRLFSALILVDPVLVRHAEHDHEPRTGPPLHEGAIARRDTWASREEAHALLSANPFFGAWDPRVLSAYVERGLVSAPGGGVCLVMPPLQEALVFAGTESSGRVWDLLPTLDARISLRWVVPGRPGGPEIGGPGATQERVWRRPANSSNVRIAQAGHLIVQEAPRELAREIAAMVDRKVASNVGAKL